MGSHAYSGDKLLWRAILDSDNIEQCRKLG